MRSNLVKPGSGVCSNFSRLILYLKEAEEAAESAAPQSGIARPKAREVYTQNAHSNSTDIHYLALASCVVLLQCILLFWH
eukprot:2338422-Amphidinium_carterae.1